MINCPNCGRPVLAGQRFCGNCGFDVQTALVHQPPVQVPPPPPAYNYSQPYGNTALDFLDATAPPSTTRAPVIPITFLLIGVALVCFICGILIGVLGFYWLGPA